jgi:hypothetical protein
MKITSSFVRAVRHALTAIALLLVIAASAATAQITQCGSLDYRVDLTSVPVSSNCYPIAVSTDWSGTIVGNSYTMPGVYFEHPPVPAGTPLSSVTVCGTVLPAAPGQYQVFCGAACVYCVRICTTAANCLVIKIYAGLCPVGPLPCP